MSSEDLLKLEARRRIYNCILKSPGIHFREISREVEMPKSTTYYHLNYLEYREFISSNKEGKFLR